MARLKSCPDTGHQPSTCPISQPDFAQQGFSCSSAKRNQSRITDNPAHLDSSAGAFFLIENWLGGKPRSQRRDLGHPSVASSSQLVFAHLLDSGVVARKAAQGRIELPVAEIGLLHHTRCFRIRERAFGGLVPPHRKRHRPTATHLPLLRPEGRRHKQRLLPPAPSLPPDRRRQPGFAATGESVRRLRPREWLFTGMPSSLKMVKVSLRLKATPSRMARTMWPREWSIDKPTRAARAWGSRCGVRSPHEVRRPQHAPRSGRNLGCLGAQLVIGIGAGTPWRHAEGIAKQRSERPAAWVTPITCQRPGIAWQKVCSLPRGSVTGASLAANTTPGGANRCAHVPWADDTHTCGPGSLIAGAGHHRRSGLEPGSGGRRFSDIAHDLL